MSSASDRYVLVYNGELYNHAEMRGHLTNAGHLPNWRGHSDTETLIEAIDFWGVEKTLERANGMFALALWDRLNSVLWLARDRFGEKPLYYGWSGGSFVFGSELKALRAHPGFDNPICRHALAQYFRVMYVPAPSSIYEGIFKLEPGCLLRLEGAPPETAPGRPLRPADQHGSLTVRRWWSLAAAAQEGGKALIRDPVEAKERLTSCLRSAVSRQSIADVPLGAFLSGGVDSSLIVALMQDQSNRPVKTFTVGFADSDFDESVPARLVAHHLGTDHTEVMVTAKEARAVIPDLPEIYDEPFSDSSQIPTYLVCKAARQQVTVAVTGDAGDELFGGYNRYLWAPRIWRWLGPLPPPIRHALAAGLMSVSPKGWDRLASTLNRSDSRGISRVGEKAHKLGSRLRAAQTIDDFYLSLVSEWQEPERLVLGVSGTAVPAALSDCLPVGLDDFPSQMMFRDSTSYLPDDILCKVDRASMANSLETRIPFLDSDVVSLAWKLPMTAKIQGQEGKLILRQILDDFVPRNLIERPKTGFGIPVGRWLQYELRDWAEALLNEDRLRREGYIDPAPVREMWSQHLRGNFDWSARLWSILMFQSWLESTH